MTIDLSQLMPASAALACLPAKTARALGALPVSLQEGKLLVCVADATDEGLRERLERLVGERTVALIEPEDPATLKSALRLAYPDAELSGEMTRPEVLFAHILQRALHRHASDIHLDPTAEGIRLRLRIDGHLQTERLDSAEVGVELTSYLKVLANLDIAEKRIPQDGQIETQVEGRSVSLRVATVPTIYGEHVTLRLLSQAEDDASYEDLGQLGMHPRQHRLFEQALACPNGVIVLSGPTGSGKTTTLYAALRKLAATDDLHLVSIEDPVEKPVAGVTQIKVDSRQDRVGFEKALRSILRHDPDVVMIGEIRDAETAETAMRSALTGHLVLTTLHTNDAPGILTRLVDLGVPPYLVASTLRLAVAQRLLRRPCPSCRTWVPASAELCTRVGWDVHQPPQIPKIHGCAYCANTGYAGRTAAYEMLPVDAAVRSMLLAGQDEGALARHLRELDPSLTLIGDAAAKVLEGETTGEELCAVVASEF